MIEHPNSFLIHQCLQAVSNGDTEALRTFWTEDIVWTVKGASPWNGEMKGPDQIFDFLAQLGEVGSDGYQIDIEDVMIGDERASIIVRIRASQGPRNLDARIVLLTSIASRRIHEVISVPIDAERVAAFWKG